MTRGGRSYASAPGHWFSVESSPCLLRAIPAEAGSHKHTVGWMHPSPGPKPPPPRSNIPTRVAFRPQCLVAVTWCRLPSRYRGTSWNQQQRFPRLPRGVREQVQPPLPSTAQAADAKALTPNLSLIQADEGCFRDRIVTCFPLDVPARRIAVHSQVLRGEGEKPEVIAVRPVAMRDKGRHSPASENR